MVVGFRCNSPARAEPSEESTMGCRGIGGTAALLTLIAAAGLALSCPVQGATLEVGPGKPFTRIEQANTKAQPGDVIQANRATTTTSTLVGPA